MPARVATRVCAKTRCTPIDKRLDMFDINVSFAESDEPLDPLSSKLIHKTKCERRELVCWLGRWS